MKVIPVVIGVPGNVLVIGVPKTFWKKEIEELEIRGEIETVQTIVVLRSARIIRRLQRAKADLLSLNLQ